MISNSNNNLSASATEPPSPVPFSEAVTTPLAPTRPRPVVLLMLGGWGVSKSRDNNAIRLAKIPNFKELVSHYPATILTGSSAKDSLNYAVLGAGQIEPTVAMSLARILSDHNLKQLKIAETEKFALVTNFFNNSDEPLIGEEQVLVPSSEKASEAVTAKLIKAIKSSKYDFVLTALADIDRVSATGDLDATVKAIESIDKILKKITKAVLAVNGLLIITSAHGYAEEVFDIQTEAVNKNNTDNPVPFLIIGESFAGKTIGFSEAPANDLSLLEPAGSLVDIAPTILKIMDLETPAEMEGKSLI